MSVEAMDAVRAWVDAPTESHEAAVALAIDQIQKGEGGVLHAVWDAVVGFGRNAPLGSTERGAAERLAVRVVDKMCPPLAKPAAETAENFLGMVMQKQITPQQRERMQSQQKTATRHVMLLCSIAHLPVPPKVAPAEPEIAFHEPIDELFGAGLVRKAGDGSLCLTDEGWRQLERIGVVPAARVGE